MAPPQPNRCAACNKIATNSCRGCKDAPNEDNGKLQSTYYCELSCQKVHWRSHQHECKARSERRTLYRVGTLAQQMFLITREKLFDIKVSKVEAKRGILQIHTEPPYEHVALIPFPESLGLSLEEKHAILSHAACTEAMKDMADFVGPLLQGLCSVMEDVKARVIDCPRETILTCRGESRPAKMYKHYFWKVKLKHGGVYVVDLTGAQYGHPDPVTAVQQYTKVMKVEYEAIDPFGQYQKTFPYLPTFAVNPMAEFLTQMTADIMTAWHEAVCQWETTELRLTDLIQLPATWFEQKSCELNTHLGLCLDEVLKNLHGENSLLIKRDGMSLIASHSGTLIGHPTMPPTEDT